MHAMAEWYMRGEQYDQAKLSRILDVAQDLKVSLEGQVSTYILTRRKSQHYFLKIYVSLSGHVGGGEWQRISSRQADLLSMEPDAGLDFIT